MWLSIILGLLITISVSVLALVDGIKVIITKRTIDVSRPTLFTSKETILTGTSAIIHDISIGLSSIAVIVPMVVGIFIYPYTGYSWHPFIPLSIWCSAFPISFIGISIALAMNPASNQQQNNNH